MRIAVSVVLLLFVAWPAAGAVPTDAEVDRVARELRCVVCQSLSVADSPSELAGQMREMVRQRLAAGESPDQVKAYFVSRYGEWVLLSPPTRGFSLLAWVLPLAVLGGGLGGTLLLLRRWSQRGVTNDEGAAEIDAETLETVRREVKRRAP